jgi:hypothetical protein
MYPWGNTDNHWPFVWTPYAEAIAAEYGVVVPYYMPVPTNLEGSSRELRTVLMPPYHSDVLLFGAHINMGTDSNGDNGQQIFLQVSDTRTGLTWAAPGPLNSAPATAYGGSRTQPMPILALPEAFFLPAHDQMQFDWKMFSQTAIGGSITWVGVQLSQPKSGKAPEFVEVNGERIKVGSRRPWLATIGLGTQISVLGAPFFAIDPSARYLHYTPPVDCDTEIHDLHANYFTQGGISSTPANILLGLSDRGKREFWQVNLAPSPAMVSDFTKAYPSLPLAKPYVLKKGRRLRLSLLNLNALTINNAFAVIRGVRRCDY